METTLNEATEELAGLMAPVLANLRNPRAPSVNSNSVRNVRWDDNRRTYSGAGFYQLHKEALTGTGLELEDGRRFFDRIPAMKLDAAWEALRQPGGSLVLFGPRGTGKTQLATYLALKDAWRDCCEGKGDYSMKYAPWPDLLAEEKNRFSGDSNRELECARTANLLVLDEVFEAISSDWEGKELTRIIDRRYGHRQRTILVGNANADDLLSTIGTSAYSRLAETGALFKCDWEPYR